MNIRNDTNSVKATFLPSPIHSTDPATCVQQIHRLGEVDTEFTNVGNEEMENMEDMDEIAEDTEAEPEDE